ncbi:MAG: hypothetical protein SCH39_05960 [Methanosarcinales archaeon]|nr:hypothetical protein [ANME-2 cluster archaeon]MCL7474618.1 hypothetical protein [ANME-2 cluster archaeon]MDW7775869.1 hypothetical protein [Methanosarcinales archaeon]
MKLIYYILIGIGIGILIIPTLIIYSDYSRTEPLQFRVNNYDTREHLIRIEIFNPQMAIIFNQTYSVNPETQIYSPEIIRKKGNYLFKISLDDTFIESFDAGVGPSYSTVEIKLFGTYSGELEPLYILQSVY